jgi:hypothetical protein
MAMTKQMLALHRWLGLVAGAMILVAAGTAVGLNHADLIKGALTSQGPGEGPYSQHVLAVASDVTNADHVLVGTTAGLFTSADAGVHWTMARLGEPESRVGALLTDTQTPGLVYAAVGADTVYSSHNAGSDWQPVSLPFASGAETQVHALAFDATHHLLVATNAGIYRETGTHWAFTPRPNVAGVERARAMQAFLERLHMGDVWGRFGVPVTDVVAISLITLVLSGYFLFINREVKIRQAKRKVRITMAQRAVEKKVPATV